MDADTEDDAREKRSQRLLTASTILLALAAVAIAWSSFQAARWSTVEYRKASGHTTSLRFQATRAQGLAEAQTQADLATFIQWVDAYVLGRTELADFYFRRFRKEFRPAVLAWLATKPLTNRQAPLSPFAMPQYKPAAGQEAARLDAEARVYSAIGQRNNERSTNYVLGVVLFSVSLFFAGLSTKIGSLRHQEALLVIGGLIFLTTLVWIVSSPVSAPI